MSLAGRILKDEKGTLGRHELNQRIDEVSADPLVGKAVATAIAAMSAAVAVLAAGAGAAAAGSS